MNFIAPGAEPLNREISLSRLALAPENVRKTPPDAQADAALKASIAAFGLLENLVVRPDPGTSPGQAPYSDGSERFAVVAGGRRLKAMQALVEDKVLDADHPVPCQVRSGDAESGEVSLAENVVRIAMHPADQVTAFAKLVEAGQSVSAIAARFGASERIVEQRLRLGNAAPELLDAYRALPRAIDAVAVHGEHGHLRHHVLEAAVGLERRYAGRTLGKGSSGLGSAAIRARSNAIVRR